MGAFKKLESVRLDSFDGGLNTKSPAIDLPLNQSPAITNVVFDDYGALTWRNGYAPINTDPVSAYSGSGLHSYVNSSGTARLVGAWRDSLYQLSGTTFVTIGSSQGLYTAGVNVELKTVRNYLFISNGGADPYKWNGTDFTRVLPSGVTQAITQACNAAGSLTGTYEYVYWGVNSMGAQTDYGGITNSLTVASGYVRVSNIPTAPASHGIETWNIGRNTAQGSGLFYLVTSVTNGVTSLTDVAADSTLLELAPTDQGYPRKFKYMIFHKGYLWGAGEPDNPSYLWFSNINQPCEYPTTNFIEVGFGDGMVITGLAIQNDMLVISKSDTKGQTALWTLTISDSSGVASPDNWYLQKTNSLWGAESHRSMVNFSNSLGFLNRFGFFGFTGDDTLLTTSGQKMLVDSLSFDIEPDIAALTAADLPRAAAIVWKNKIWLYSETALFQFDFVRSKTSDRRSGAWTKFDGPGINCFAIHEGNLYAQASGNIGVVYKLDTGTTDKVTTASTAFNVNAVYTTGVIAGKKEHTEITKTWRYIYLVLGVNSGAYFIYVSAFTNFGSSAGYSKVLSGSSSDGQIQVVIPIPGSSIPPSKSIQIQLSNWETNTLLAQYFKVHSIEIYYSLRSLR